MVKTIQNLDGGLADARDLLDMAVEEDDEDSVADVQAELASLTAELETLEFRRMFSGELDENKRLLRNSGGLRRHRSAGLGQYDAAHVSALDREPWL